MVGWKNDRMDEMVDDDSWLYERWVGGWYILHMFENSSCISIFEIIDPSSHVSGGSILGDEMKRERYKEIEMNWSYFINCSHFSSWYK